MDEGGFLQNLGVVNFAGTGGNLVSFPTLLNPNPIFNMVFGFDLISPALQNPNSPIGNQFDFSNTITAVPEPGTLALLGLALVGVAAVRRKKAATV